MDWGVGPIVLISRWARFCADRWDYLPDGPDGARSPMGPMARWPGGRLPAGTSHIGPSQIGRGIHHENTGVVVVVQINAAFAGT